ncbi:MAG: hypothetical protein WA949_07325 [Phormidesmis sp.]
MTLEGDTDDATAPNWRTIRNYPLRPRSLWKKWQDLKTLAGVRFGKDTEYALIDLDKGGKFHSAESIAEIQAALETIGIVRTIPIRSSWNDGRHLYCPLPYKVPTFDLACAIRYTLEAQDIHLEAGQVEVFPNTKAFAKGWLGQFSEYNGHRLPLQPGSGGAMLDHDLNPMGASLERFFATWDFCVRAQDMDALEEALITGRERHRKRPKAKNHPLDEWRADWELEIQTGWTDHGQTNGLLKVISGYGRVFERLEGEDLEVFVLHTAITAPGFAEFCQHGADIGSKVAAWCRAAERYYWPLGDEPKRDKTAFDFNQERAIDAQSRIKAAYEWLKKRGEWPETITAQLKALSQKAKASFKTLYKYSQLWNPLERCVTVVREGDRGDSTSLNADTADPPKPAPYGELHTTNQITKGVSMKPPLQNSLFREREGLQGERKGFPQADEGGGPWNPI